MFWLGILPSALAAETTLDDIGDTYVEYRENFSPGTGQGVIVVVSPEDIGLMIEFELGAQPTITKIDINAGGYKRAHGVISDAITDLPSREPTFCDDYGADIIQIITEGERVAHLSDGCPNGRVSEIINAVALAVRR